jgi:hypothetical protein
MTYKKFMNGDLNDVYQKLCKETDRVLARQGYLMQQLTTMDNERSRNSDALYKLKRQRDTLEELMESENE